MANRQEGANVTKNASFPSKHGFAIKADVWEEFWELVEATQLAYKYKTRFEFFLGKLLPM